MSVVLWPRQEVLQLVIPQLSTVGRVLNTNCILDVVWRLARFQNSQGQVSFSRWQTVAREVLKWNDYCIHLFWEIVILAVYYLNSDAITQNRREDIAIDLDCVAILLVFHMADKETLQQQKNALGNGSSPAAATASYDSIWPLNPEGEVYPSSPVASPVSSPIRESRAHRVHSPGGSSPLSPNSPRGSPQTASSSLSLSLGSAGSAFSRSAANIGATTTTTTARTPRGSTHYLHSVQQKIPLILRALCQMSDTPYGEDFASEEFAPLNCVVNRRVVDFLGLIVCGGHSRDQMVSRFSSLHPLWSSDADTVQSEAVLAEHTLPATDFVRWINQHLSMNDVLYPVSFTPVGILPVKESASGAAAAASPGAVDADPRTHTPHKHVAPWTSLSRMSPTVINGSSSTVVHALSMVSSRQTSFRRGSSARSASQDNNSSSGALTPRQPATSLSAAAIVMSDCEDGQEMLLSSAPSSEPHSPSPHSGRFAAMQGMQCYRDDESGGEECGSASAAAAAAAAVASTHKPDSVLPQLFVSYCTQASLYLLSPYYSASVTGCLDTSLVVSAVYGAVIVNGCERVKLTVACRKLIVMNCIDCEFNVATLSSTIVLGDSRNLVMGPFNSSFSNLHNHLRMAELLPLAKKMQSSRQMLTDDDVHGNNSYSLETLQSSEQNNLWSSICDVNACLEAVCGAGTFISTAGGMSGPLPSPSGSSIAALQSPDAFRVASVPWKTEQLGFEFSAIAIPREFVQTVRAQHAQVEDIKSKIAQFLNANSANDNDMSSDDAVDASTTRLLSSSAISRRFLDWLVANDRLQEVLDLIRIDSDKTTVH